MRIAEMLASQFFPLWTAQLTGGGRLVRLRAIQKHGCRRRGHGIQASEWPWARGAYRILRMKRAARNTRHPYHHKLEAYLDQYIAAVGIAGDTAGPLFRTTGRFTGTPHRMTQFDVYRMIQKYGTAAGIKTKIGNHSLRATGITDYLKSNGTLEHAQAMANHSSPRTTKLYDRRTEVDPIVWTKFCLSLDGGAG
jgi:Phage integrase family